MSDTPANLQAYADVMDAVDRLAEHDLALHHPDGTRGLTDDGLRTLADLLTVAVFQLGGGRTPAEQTAGATGRAMLAALSDVYRLLADGPGDVSANTMKLLADATRTARS